MAWELAHRNADTHAVTWVTLEAASSWDAVTDLRGKLPEGETVLLVRRLG